MKKLFLSIIILFLVLYIDSFSQSIENLNPQPKCAYIRNQYSAVFSLGSVKNIYLNPKAPDYFAAKFLNSELRKRKIDTIPVKVWDDTEKSLQGIVLSTSNSFVNKLFDNINDQKISISNEYPGKEGYILDIIGMQCIVAGSDSAGLFYGIQTLMQLLNFNNFKNPIRFCRIVDAPDFPIRWFYYPTNVLVQSNTDKAKAMFDTAAAYKLNGMLFTDYKFGFISQMPPRYFDSLNSINQYAKQNFLNLVPGIFSFGYSNDILFHDPNLASGLPVKSQKFVVLDDTARLIPSSNISLSNPGFELYNGNNFPGFGYIDQPGVLSYVDTIIKHSGKASIKFTNFESAGGYTNARVTNRAVVKPYTQFHLGAWVKSQNIKFSYRFQMMAIGNKGRTLCFQNIDLAQTTDWKKFDITFNTLDADTINVYWGVWGPQQGAFWLDDLVFEEIPFMNLIRRPGAPLTIRNIDSSKIYSEGFDFDSLKDKKMGMVNPWPGDYDSYHTPIPSLVINNSGQIKNGDTLLADYYHSVVIYDGQVMVSMTEPMTYYYMEKEFKLLDSLIKPSTYFMGHDEIRTMNWDESDRQTNQSPALILADNVKKCVKLINKYNPQADIWDWSDMFDPYHNAVPGINNYYLVNGDLGGVADWIPKSIGIANWNFGKSKESLNYFDKGSFRQISTPFYDTDQNHIRKSKESSIGINNFQGMMYTTWASNYKYVPQFGYYAWSHAPFIYHQPVYGISPDGDINMSINIQDDMWDSGWFLSEARVYYRTNTSDEFKFITLDIPHEGQADFKLTLPKDNEYLEYYITAADNRGWLSKVPYGANNYYKLGNIINNVANDKNTENALNLNSLTLKEENLQVDVYSNIQSDITFNIYNIIGNIQVSNRIEQLTSGSNQLNIDVSQLIPGTYILSINSKQQIIRKLFIKL